MRYPTKAWIISIGLNLLLPLSAQAEEPLDPVSQEALQKTQELLTQPDLRKKALADDPNAAATDQQVGAVAGSPANKDAMYQLSAELLQKIAVDAQGDPVKMREMVLKYQTNPESLNNKLTPEQKAKINELSKQVPAATATPH